MNHIVLTGGTSKRFGSDKSAALINNKSLLEILLTQLNDEKVIVVGPETKTKARYVQENPISGGPVAAIAAGMELVTEDLVAIFATDMPFAPKILDQLKISLINDAALPVDDEGIMQPLAGLYKSDALRNALKILLPVAGKSMKQLIALLNVSRVPLNETDWLIDIDTQADLMRAIELQSRLSQ